MFRTMWWSSSSSFSFSFSSFYISSSFSSCSDHDDRLPKIPIMVADLIQKILIGRSKIIITYLIRKYYPEFLNSLKREVFVTKFWTGGCSISIWCKFWIFKANPGMEMFSAVVERSKELQFLLNIWTFIKPTWNYLWHMLLAIMLGRRAGKSLLEDSSSKIEKT